MDFLHSQVAALQGRLAFVAVELIPWQTYVLAFSWVICTFESYLLYAPTSSHIVLELIPLLPDCVNIRFIASRRPLKYLPSTSIKKSSTNLKSMESTKPSTPL